MRKQELKRLWAMVVKLTLSQRRDLMAELATGQAKAGAVADTGSGRRRVSHPQLMRKQPWPFTGTNSGSGSAGPDCVAATPILPAQTASCRRRSTGC